MRELVVLRHSLTRKGVDRRATGSHLSSEGVQRARALGETLPEMAYVVVGDQPRHFETALALGCAVDEQTSLPSGYVAGEVAHHDQWSWDQPFVRYSELLATSPGLARVAQVHLGLWSRVLDRVPDGCSGLVVSSGGSIEPVLVAAMPAASHRDWGSPFHQLEGAALSWDGSEFTALRFLRRVPT